jgi:SAM-dependent methyltransferase
MDERPSSALHPLVGGFSDADAYEKGRPAYGVELVRELMSRLELGTGAPVLELGAGTGQLSRALLAGGLDVTAVEPLESMRALLAQAIGAERVRAGVAEAIPLEDGAAQAVFAADSFHWFEEAKALGEIRRVLRARGGLAILRTTPVLDGAWGQELGELLMSGRPEHPAFGERSAAAAVEEDDAFGPVHELTLSDEQSSDRERILAYLSSLSWVGILEPKRRSELLADAEGLLRRHGVAEVRVRIVHQIWLSRLS